MTTDTHTEAMRLADEAKQLVVDALNLAESTMPPFVGVSPAQHAICKALDAIDALAALAQPAVSEDAERLDWLLDNLGTGTLTRAAIDTARASSTDEKINDNQL